jgi:hypothetical protein
MENRQDEIGEQYKEKNNLLRCDSNRVLQDNNPNFDFEKFIHGVNLLYQECVKDSARKNSPWGDVPPLTDSLARYCIEIDRAIQDDINFHQRVIACIERNKEGVKNGSDPETFDYSQDRPGHNPPSNTCKVCGCGHYFHYPECLVLGIGHLEERLKDGGHDVQKS